LQNSDFIKDFMEEAITHVEAVEEGLLKLESGEGDADLIHGIFRNVHSIKGTAGFFSLKNIVDLSHAMENLFGEIRNGNIIINKDMIDVLLSANDTLKSMVCDVENSNLVDVSVYLEKISAIMNEDDVAAAIEFLHQDLPISKTAEKPIAVTGHQKAVILDALKQGHRLYSLQIIPDALNGYVGKIESVGQLVGACNDDTILLVTTVLEHNLLSMALDFPQEHISELQEDDLFQADSAPVSTGTANPPAVTKSMPAGEFSFGSITNQTEAPNAGDSGNGVKKHHNANYEDTIRVHISLLNDLLDLASEMVLGRNQLLRTLESQRKKIPGLNAVLQNIDGITTELQEKIMQTRMQPVDKVFKKFPRIIRELSYKLKKEIELEMSGGDVELDKSIIEALGDPLTHLIRNAVDHGIEPPELRDAGGKPQFRHNFHASIP